MIIDLDTLKELIKEKRTLRKILKDYCITFKFNKNFDIDVSGDTVGLQYRIHSNTDMCADLTRVYKKQMLRRYKAVCRAIKYALKDIDKEV